MTPARWSALPRPVPAGHRSIMSPPCPAPPCHNPPRPGSSVTKSVTIGSSVNGVSVWRSGSSQGSAKSAQGSVEASCCSYQPKPEEPVPLKPGIDFSPAVVLRGGPSGKNDPPGAEAEDSGPHAKEDALEHIWNSRERCWSGVTGQTDITAA